ncbi:MAG: HEAT repeat domain-containing protein [Planctomycetes bacterium]|nr:HEAT repeat domain-containing protein [Planctomycetota bacterium]
MFDQLLRSFSILPAVLAASLIGGSAQSNATMQGDDPKDPPAQPVAEPAEEPAAEPASANAPSATDPAEQFVATAAQSHDLDMALHYILIGNATLAKSSIQTLFDSGITDEQLAQLIDAKGIREKVERSLTRGRGMEGAAELVAELESRYLAGTRATSRNALRIEEAVQGLGGSMRQEMVSRQRLLAAGAFAVPSLLKALGDVQNLKLANSARSVLVEIKRLAVAPLCAALADLDPDTQRKVCEVLGEIGYPSSQAYIFDLATNPSTTADVRTAALRAYSKLGGTSQDAASQYTALARRFFDQTPSLIPYAGDPNNVVWSYDNRNGLTGVEIPTTLYCETMAIQTATEALRRDPTSELALAIYVAADLRRSVFMDLLKIQGSSESPESSILATRYSAEFFGTASGARIAQMALGFAIDASDVMLARECIRVLGANGGAATLITPMSGRSPIIECLLFADRRVRFEAAVVLAKSLPVESFQQQALVVPVLASMIQSGGMTGAVIASVEEDRQSLATRMSSVGVNTVTTGASISEIEGKLSSGQTLDLIVIQGAHASVNDAIHTIRLSRSAATSPIVVIANGSDASAFSLEFENDSRVSVFLSSATDAQFLAAIESAAGAAGGIAMSPEESAKYLDESLAVLRMIAGSSSAIFDVRVAQADLIGALATSSGTVKSSVAGVLALLSTDTAQRALMDSALAASSEDQAMLLMSVATSARKFGNLLQPNQIESLRTLIQNSSGSTADAAGQAFGALGLPTSEVVKLILTPKK